MKSCFASILLFMLGLTCKAQVAFTIAPSVCVGNSVSVAANTGTLVNPSFNWLASPAGAVFSNSLSATTNITFTATGNYTVLLVVISGTAIGFTQNTITVSNGPVVSFFSSVSLACPFTPINLIAGSVPNTNYTFVLPSGSLVATGLTNTLAILAPSINAFPAIYTVIAENSGCQSIATATLNAFQFVPPVLSHTPNLPCSGANVTLTAHHFFPGYLPYWSYTFSIISPSISSYPASVINSLSVSQSVNTVYQVKVDSAWCSSSATIAINVAPAVNLTLTQNTYTTCIMNNSPKLSKPVQLNAFGATSYVWFPYQTILIPCGNCPQTTVRPHANTCYTVVGTSAVTGCTGSAITCVTVVPQFTFNVSPASTLICTGQTVELVAGNIGAGAVGFPSSFTHSWTESNPVTMNTILNDTVLAFPNLNTTYTVDVADSFGCVSSPVTVTVAVNDCVNLIENANNDLAFVLFPNPVTEKLIVESYLFQIEELELHNSLGQKLMHQHLGESKTVSLSVLHLPLGVYSITITNKDGQTFQKKFVKE